MSLKDHIKEITTKNLKSFYIYAGEEQQVMNVYINKISEVLNIPIKRINSVREHYSYILGRSLVSERCLYVVRDDAEIQKNDAWWPKFKSLKNSILIVIYPSVNRNYKFFKDNTDNIVEFEKMTEDQLCLHIRKRCQKLSENDARRLANICQFDYGRSIIECDKLNIVNKNTGNIIDFCLEEGLLYHKPKDETFEFVDSVLSNNSQKSFKLLDSLIKLKVPELLVLNLLYSNFRSLLLVQSTYGSDVNCGLSSYIINLMKSKIHNYSIRELVENLKVIREVEKSIKIGKIDSDIALQYCTVNILRS